MLTEQFPSIIRENKGSTYFPRNRNVNDSPSLPLRLLFYNSYRKFPPNLSRLSISIMIEISQQRKVAQVFPNSGFSNFKGRTFLILLSLCHMLFDKSTPFPNFFIRRGRRSDRSFSVYFYFLLYPSNGIHNAHGRC